MDTNQNQFSNILKALNSPQLPNPEQTPAPAISSAGGLSYQQQSDNYKAFSELMSRGVSLPDLLKHMEDLEGRVKILESQPKHDANAELLAVMEQAVKGDPEVKTSRQKVADVKTTILTEICMRDQRYRDALESYKTTVNRVYIQSRESDGGAERIAEEVETPQGGGTAEVCDDSERGVHDQEGVS